MDPVLGDNGKLYLPMEMISLYKQHLIPLAELITPNQFEAELLSGKQISCIQDAVLIAKEFCVPQVVITSVVFEGCWSLICHSKHVKKTWQITYPHIKGHFTGTGDLFSSLLLAARALNIESLPKMCSNAIYVMQQVLIRTNKNRIISDNISHVLRSSELQVISSQKDISNLIHVTEEDLTKFDIKVISLT